MKTVYGKGRLRINYRERLRISLGSGKEGDGFVR
jgi:hypothetical protein